ncbi:stage II sporulation protein M [Paenibacillus abyssi]|uniref:Stage II sporulation protein M n=1 Tax=Paenibacillus abyssi TaxID=1340531 RepID=A0A917CFH1_9BACL|nr:stage II sporulation protein M [Paenibacillus abyssi]GGF87332.1 stage II sporulation protein M [Paenibacillus abyssi]
MRSPFLQPLVKDQLSLYIFVSVLFAVGVVFGALLVGALTLEQQQDLTGDVEHFVRLLSAGMGPDETQSFVERGWFHTKWLLLIWLLGLTVVGMPLILALDFLKGVLIGFSVGLLVSQHAWEGVLFSLASVAPPNLIILPAILIASVSAISFSIHIVKHRLMQRSGTLLQPFLSHTSVAVVMLAVLWGAALFEAFVSPILMGWASSFIIGSGTGF